MNSKFFDVNKEKQDNIINAALKLFAEKGYKDASTDVIVKQAGISKGLLFHYFISKQGLYEFVCNYSTKYMILEVTRSVKSSEKDFFNIMSQIELGKMRVSRNYPYMQMFLRSIQFEKDAEAIAAMGDSVEELKNAYSNIYAQIDPKKFINPEDCEQVIKMIEWINDGFMKEELSLGATVDEVYDKFAEILSVMRKHFYRSEDDEKVSIAKEELYERDESVMDDFKMEMTFEERLLAGKRPLVDLPPEEEKDDENEEDKKDEVDSEDKTDSEDKADEKSEANENVNEETTDKKESDDSSNGDGQDESYFFDEDDEEEQISENSSDDGKAPSDKSEDGAEAGADEIAEETVDTEEEYDNNGITEDDVVIAPTVAVDRFATNTGSALDGVNVPVFRPAE